MTNEQDVMERGEAGDLVAGDAQPIKPLDDSRRDIDQGVSMTALFKEHSEPEEPTVVTNSPSPEEKTTRGFVASCAGMVWDKIHAFANRLWNPFATPVIPAPTRKSPPTTGNPPPTTGAPPSTTEVPPTTTEHPPKPSQTKVRILSECPAGYPQLAAMLDSEENLMLYRRYGFLQARLLLHKQSELQELEWALDRLDNFQAESAEGRDWLRSRHNDDADSGKRKELLHEIEEKFLEYGNLLLLARDLVSLRHPSNEDYASVKRYFDIKQPTLSRERYILYREDIISLNPAEENTWLDNSIQAFLLRCHSPFIRNLFTTADLRRKTKSEPGKLEVLNFDRGRISGIVSSIMTTIIVVLLIIPVYILWRLSNSAKSSSSASNTSSGDSSGGLSSHLAGSMIGILLAFTLFFSMVLTFFTSAKRHELVTAAAAYCAVLVVFLGNIG